MAAAVGHLAPPCGAYSFPRGEAVARNGSSEPFLVTEEGWRNVLIIKAVGKEGAIFNVVPFYFYCISML
jgi:hypothetical protein